MPKYNIMIKFTAEIPDFYEGYLLATVQSNKMKQLRFPQGLQRAHEQLLGARIAK